MKIRMLVAAANANIMNLLHVIAPLLCAFPAFGQNHVGKDERRETECKGIIHGVVFARDGKPWSGIGVVLEPVGAYNYVLPRAKTDQQGEYRFEKVCSGRWGVFVEDKEAGYPHSGRLMNWFLYGSWSPEMKITDKNLDGQLNVNVPPKPGMLVVHLADSKTKAKIPRIELELKVNRKRWARHSCEDSESFSCEGYSFLVPPDQDVRLHVASKGFQEWKATSGRGKFIHVPSGELQTINVELDRTSAEAFSRAIPHLRFARLPGIIDSTGDSYFFPVSNRRG